MEASFESPQTSPATQSANRQQLHVLLEELQRAESKFQQDSDTEAEMVDGSSSGQQAALVALNDLDISRLQSNDSYTDVLENEDDEFKAGPVLQMSRRPRTTSGPHTGVAGSYGDMSTSLDEELEETRSELRVVITTSQILSSRLKTAIRTLERLRAKNVSLRFFSAMNFWVQRRLYRKHLLAKAESRLRRRTQTGFLLSWHQECFNSESQADGVLSSKLLVHWTKHQILEASLDAGACPFRSRRFGQPFWNSLWAMVGKLSQAAFTRWSLLALQQRARRSFSTGELLRMRNRILSQHMGSWVRWAAKEKKLRSSLFVTSFCPEAAVTCDIFLSDSIHVFRPTRESAEKFLSKKIAECFDPSTVRPSAAKSQFRLIKVFDHGCPRVRVEFFEARNVPGVHPAHLVDQIRSKICLWKAGQSANLGLPLFTRIKEVSGRHRMVFCWDWKLLLGIVQDWRTAVGHLNILSNGRRGGNQNSTSPEATPPPPPTKKSPQQNRAVNRIREIQTKLVVFEGLVRNLHSAKALRKAEQLWDFKAKRVELGLYLDRFFEAVENSRAEKERIERIIRKKQYPCLIRTIQKWWEFITARRIRALERRAAKEHEQYIYRMATENRTKQKAVLSVERAQERQLEMGRKAAARMQHRHIATAFGWFRECVWCLRSRKRVCAKVLQRMLNLVVATAMEGWRTIVHETRNRQQRVAHVIGKWKAPEQETAFIAWLEHMDVSREERARTDHAEVTEQKDARQQEICRRIIQRMLNSQLSAALGRFVDAVSWRRSTREILRRVAHRIMHRTHMAVWVTWVERVRTKKNWRQRVTRVWLHVCGNTLRAVIDWWRDGMSEQQAARDGIERLDRRHLEIGTRVSLRVKGRQLMIAFRDFAQIVAVVRERRRIGGKISRSVQRRQSQMALQAWDDAIVRVKERWRVACRVVQRLMHLQQESAMQRWKLGLQHQSERKQGQQQALQRLLSLVLARALDGFVAAVQGKKEMRRKGTRLVAMLRSRKLLIAFAQFASVTQTLKGRRQRAARIWMHVCGNTLRAAIDGWRDGMSEQRAERDKTSTTQKRLEEKREVCTRVILRMQQTQLAFAMEGFVAAVQGKKEMRRKGTRLVAMLRSRKLLIAFAQFASVTQTLKGRRQRAARIWMHVCGNTLRAAIDGWRDGMSEQRAERDKTSTTQKRLEEKREVCTRVILRMQQTQLAFAMEGFVAAVQGKKEMRRKGTRLVAMLRSRKLLIAFAQFASVTQTLKVGRQRAARIWMHVCGNTLRAAIDGWRDGISQQCAARERLAMEKSLLESHKDLCTRVILRMQQSQLAFAFDVYVQGVQGRKRLKRKGTSLISALTNRKLLIAFAQLALVTQTLKVGRHRAARIWKHVRENALRAAVDGWLDGVSEQRAAQERLSIQQNLLESHKEMCESHKDLCTRVILRMQQTQLAFAFDVYVQGVQGRKRLKRKGTSLISALTNRKLLIAFAQLALVTQTLKVGRQRAAQMWTRVCINTLRAAVDGWLDGVSEQRAARERLAMEHFKWESHKDMCARASVRMQQTQLAFAFDVYVQGVQGRKRLKRKGTSLISALTNRKLLIAFAQLALVTQTLKVGRQRAARIWKHLCENALRAAVDGWLDGISEQRAAQERLSIQQNLLERHKEMCESHKDLCTRVILRMQQTQLAFAFDVYVQGVQGRKRLKRKGTSLISALTNRKLLIAFAQLALVTQTLKVGRQRAARIWKHLCENALRAAVDGWLDGISEQRAAQERLSIQQNLLERHKEMCESHKDLCTRVILRMQQTQLAFAFDVYVQGVQGRKRLKRKGTSLISALTNRKLLIAFAQLALVTQTLKVGRQRAARIWKHLCENALRAAVDGWLDGVSEQRAAQERLSIQQNLLESHKEMCESHKDLCTRVILRMQQTQLAFAFDVYVQGVQGRKRLKRKGTSLISALTDRKLSLAWKHFTGISRNEKHLRLRTARVWLQVCRNTLRAVIEGWKYGVSEQREDRERLAMEHFKLESHKELCSKAILRIHRSQLAFAFGAYAQVVRWRKRRKNKTTRFIAASTKWKLATAWMRLLAIAEKAKVVRQHAARLLLKVCRNTLRAAIGWWQVEVSVQRAERDESAREEEQRTEQEQISSERAEQRREVITQVILQMQRMQLEFAMEGFIESVRRKKASRGRLVKALGRSIKRSLWKAWSSFVDAKLRAKNQRQRQVRIWTKVHQASIRHCSFACSRAVEGWRDGVAREQADREERDAVHGQGVAQQQMKEHQLEVGGRVARRVMRTQLAECFRRYAEGVAMLRCHRRICKRVMRRIRKLQGAAAFRRWIESVAESKGSARTLGRAVHRRRTARMASTVSAWQAATLFDGAISTLRSKVARRRASKGMSSVLKLWSGSARARARLKQIRVRIEERRYVLRQTTVFESWRQRAIVGRRLRQNLHKVTQRKHLFETSSVLHWWRLQTQLSTKFKRASRRIETKRLYVQATAAFNSWRDGAILCKQRRRRVGIRATGQRKQAGTAFNCWRDGASLCRQRRRRVGKVGRQRKHGYLATVWDVWKEAVDEAVEHKQTKRLARERAEQQKELRITANSRAMTQELSDAFSNFLRGLQIYRAQHRLKTAASVLAAKACTFKLLSSSFRGLVVRSRHKADGCVDNMVYSLLRQRALRRHWKALRHGIRLCQLSEYHEEHKSCKDSTEALCTFSLWKMHVKKTVQTQLRRRMDTFYVH